MHTRGSTNGLSRGAVPRDDWPLVGRGPELMQLERLIRSANACSGVLAGPEGVGKTRLAREFVLRADEAGRATQWISATRSTSSVPYGALSALVTGGHVPALTDLHDLHEATRLVLTALHPERGPAPPTLVVDDAHLLDPASAELIHHLASTGRAGVIATIHPGWRPPAPLTALWKDGVATRIDLNHLDDAAIHDLVSGALGGHVDHGAVAQVTSRSQGNLLYVRELVLGAVADGSLAEQDGVWRLVRPLVPSERLVELVEVALGRLSVPERDLLEYVSYGEPLGLPDLSALGEPELIAGLERQGFLHSRMSGRRLEIRLARPLDGDVLRLRMPATRRAAVARALAEAVETRGARRNEDTLRIAVWRLEAGGSSPEQLLSAAWTARWRYDFALARRLVDGALASGGGFDARLLGAQLTALEGDPERSEIKLAQLARSATGDAEFARAVIARARNLMFWLGRAPDGLQVVNAALDTVVDPGRRDELMACRTGLLLVGDGPEATIQAAEPLLERTSGPAFVYVSLAASFSLCRAGRLADALALEGRGHAAHGALATPMDWYRWLHLFAKCETLSVSGRLAEAEVLAQQQYQEGLEDGSAEQRAFFAYQLARTVVGRGHIDEAIEHAREAVILFRDLGREYYTQAMLVELGLALALGGKAAMAAETLDSIEGPPLSWAGVELLMARAWTATAAGDYSRARRLMGSAAEHGETLGDLVGAAEALHGLARIGYPDQAAEALRELAARIEGDLIQARLRHTLALRSRDPEELAIVSAVFGEMGTDLLAAEAAADEAGRWIQLADRRKAHAAASRAAEWAARCPGAATPALGNVEARSRLTVTELETAQLAASGHSSKHIADALQLSVRTVDNRLQRVYHKLGVSRRIELSEALGNRDLG